MTCCCLISCNNKQETTNNTIHLKGQLIDMGSRQVRMNYNGAASMLGDSRDLVILTDEAGRFDTTFTLNEPAYFSISRNTLYLTPGDDMVIKVTQNNKEAEFAGKGAEANNYMKHRLFPKGGSYLEAGRNLRHDFASTKLLIDSLAAVRQHTLDTLSHVSDEFKRLETARIKADVANSYISYASYSGLFKGIKDSEQAAAKWTEFCQSINEPIQPLLKAIIDESLLDVAVVRDVISHHSDSTLKEVWFKELAIPERTAELYACAEEVDRLRNEVSPQAVSQAEAFVQTVKNADFRNEVEQKIQQASKLLPGKEAIDFAITNVKGEEKHLSDFKGKVIYIDLWATWCGPCIHESPYFEKLAKEYEGKEVVFLPISTDTTVKPWLNYLKAHKKDLVQYHSNDEALVTDWAILYIPRFILIDKDFKIVNAYAPRPSEKEAAALIDATLNR